MSNLEGSLVSSPLRLSTSVIGRRFLLSDRNSCSRRPTKMIHLSRIHHLATFQRHLLEMIHSTIRTTKVNTLLRLLFELGHCPGTKYRYSLSKYSYGKDQSSTKANVMTNEMSEGQRDFNGAKNGRLLFQYRPRIARNKDQSIAFQNDKPRRLQSRTRLAHKTETKRQRQQADSTRVATTKPYTENDLHGTSPSSNTEDNEHNNFRRLKRKTNSSQDDQPTIAQLWAQESQNNTSFRRYRGILYVKHLPFCTYSNLCFLV